jgi:hypothetical protein
VYSESPVIVTKVTGVSVEQIWRLPGCVGLRRQLGITPKRDVRHQGLVMGEIPAEAAAVRDLAQTGAKTTGGCFTQTIYFKCISAIAPLGLERAFRGV